MVALSWSFVTIIRRNWTIIAWSIMSYSLYNFSRRIMQKYIFREQGSWVRTRAGSNPTTEKRKKELLLCKYPNENRSIAESQVISSKATSITCMPSTWKKVWSPKKSNAASASLCTCISSTLNDYRIWHYTCCRKKNEFRLSCHVGYRKVAWNVQEQSSFSQIRLKNKVQLDVPLDLQTAGKNEQRIRTAKR